MSNFLLIYERVSGALDVKEFPGQDGRAAALRERIDLEAKFGRDQFEVVVIAAESVQELRKTHSRYFGSVSSLSLSASRQLEVSLADMEGRIGG